MAGLSSRFVRAGGDLVFIGIDGCVVELVLLLVLEALVALPAD